jgi:hypothetical protein
MKTVLKKRLSLNERIHKVYVYNLQGQLSHDEEYDINEYFKYQYNANRKNFVYMVVHVNDISNQFEFEYYKTYDDLLKAYKTFDMFTKKDRSSFKYWFAHWCGFQLTALNLGIWKPKYLLHDIEKPWLKVFWKGDYKRVQKWHRTHNKHHLEYGLKYGWDKIDWEALMIDWECCGLSKQEAQLDARETLEYEINRDKSKSYATDISNHLLPILNKYEL